MLLDLLVKRTARDAEALRRLLDAPSLFLEHTFDVLFFELDQREASVEKRRSHLRVAVEVKVLKSDVFLVTQ